MKKILLITGCVLILVGCGNSTSATIQETEITTTTVESQSKEIETETEIETESLKRDNTDFRNSCWGDDIETVKKYEDAICEGENDETLLYKTQIENYDVSIIYEFHENKLYNSGYQFLDKHTNGGQYIIQYNVLKDSLNKVYGEPLSDEIIPLEDQLLIDMAGESKALEYGYVIHKAIWEKDNTLITIAMTSSNFETFILIRYDDKNFDGVIVDPGL